MEEASEERNRREERLGLAFGPKKSVDKMCPTCIKRV